jgi:hypothetical protein
VSPQHGTSSGCGQRRRPHTRRAAAMYQISSGGQPTGVTLQPGVGRVLTTPTVKNCALRITYKRMGNGWILRQNISTGKCIWDLERRTSEASIEKWPFFLGIFGDICSETTDGSKRRDLSHNLYIIHPTVMYLLHLCYWKSSINYFCEKYQYTNLLKQI